MGETFADWLRTQADVCRMLGSPLYGSVLDRAAEDAESGGPTLAILAGHEDDPPGSMLALRFMGAVHRVVLEGRAPALAAHYPSAGGDADGDAWPAFRSVLEEHRDALRELVECPVQTNEVGRSGALVGGFLLVAAESGLPLRLFELGASAGLNLRWDHFRYEGDGRSWGDPGSPVRLVRLFVEGRPPLDVSTDVAERRGCDPSPVDPLSEEGRRTLTSYVWPDQTERLALLSGALEIAARVPVEIERASAAEWIAERVDVAPGFATVVFNSIVSQYLGKAGRDRVRRAIEALGARASDDAPLAWLRMEPGADQADVRLTTWPGPVERLLATAGYHGRPVRWLL